MRKSLILTIIGTAAICSVSGQGSPNVVDVLLTTGDKTKLLSQEPQLLWWPIGQGQTGNIIVDSSKTYQEMEGAGAALTDSSAYLMSQQLNGAELSSLITDLFGNTGANLNYVRIPLSSSDMSTEDFTHDDQIYPATDPKLKDFQLNKNHIYNIPVLHQMLKSNPSLRLVGSAWTAPGWMKSDNDPKVRKGVIGGTLNKEYNDVYAAYLAKLIKAYETRDIPFDAITMQNEPDFKPDGYAGMFLSAQQEADLAFAVGKKFKEVGLQTKLLVHDHNWDIAQRAMNVLKDKDAYPYIDGVAFHCYGGDYTAQSTVKAAYPDKDIYFTECSGVFSAGTFQSNLMWNVNNLVIGNTRNWGKTIMLWNLALDETGKPNVGGGCLDCRGVVTIHSVTSEIIKNEEYYSLAHFGRVVMKGAYRIDSTAAFGKVQSVAYINPDGSRALILSNDDAQAASITVQEGNRIFSYTMPAYSVASFKWLGAAKNQFLQE